ncbi:hypothetical protein BH10CHL1_BH10CHL1_40130 [soil metagenome]
MKRMLRSCCFTLALLVAGAWLLTPTMYANAPITVTTTSDVIADDNLCSLREAIIAANTDSAFHDCPAGSNADTIEFALTLPKPTVISLTQSGADENNAHCGDLDITGTLTIRGTNGATPNAEPIVIDGNDTDRVFEILQGAKVAIVGVTIQHGNPGATVDGGGVLVDLTARLALTNSQIISNSALSGGGLKVLGSLTMIASLIAGNKGGGIRNDGGLVNLNTVQVRNNSRDAGIRNQAQGALLFHTGLVSANQGGGIYNASATATVKDLSIVNNTDGSGIANTGSTLSHLTISHSLIMSNTAISGGGILNEGVGAITNLNTTRVSGNTATSNGGGLFNSGIMAVDSSTIDHNQAIAGAGLYHFGGNLALTNDTISQNSATDNGGGLYNGSTATLNFVTFSDNQAGGEGGNLFIDEAALSIVSSIMDQTPTGSSCVNSNGFLTSLGHNLESADSCHFTGPSDLTDLDPLLGPLQDNGTLAGEPAFTHALLPGSPAIDSGSATCPTTDQREFVRPQGVACDIGAYEFTSMIDLAITASIAPETVTVGTNVTYTLRIHNLGFMTATALTLTDELPEGVSLLTAMLTGGVCDQARQLTCTLPTLAAGAIATATIVIAAPLLVGPITNTASIAAVTPDLNVNNNKTVTPIVVLATASDLTPPSSVANLTITLMTAQGATLHWDAATDNVGVAGYRIFAQKEGANQAFLLVGTVEGMVTTYTVTTLMSSTGYQLWVVAYDQAGNSASLGDLISVQISTLKLPVGLVQISLEPLLPTNSDRISITVSGVYTSSCTPQYQSHQQIGDLIAIQSMPSPEMFCLSAEFPWNYSIAVGPLVAGPYTVTHVLGQVMETLFFTVSAINPRAPLFQMNS